MSKVKTNDGATVKAPKYVAYRLFALLLAAAPIAVLCLLPINFLVGVEDFKQATFLSVVLDLVKVLFTGGEAEFFLSDARLFGVLPVLFETDTICGAVTNAWIYVIAIAVVLTTVFALISLFSGKAARKLAPTISLLNFWAYAGYAASIIVTCFYLQTGFPIDLYVLAIAGVSLVALIVFALIKNGASALVQLLLFLLTCAVSAAFVYAFTVLANEGTKDLISLGLLYKIVVASLVGLSVLFVFISSIRLLTKKGYGFDIFRYVLMAIITLALGVVSALRYFGVEIGFLGFTFAFTVEEALWLMIVFASAFVVSVLQIIIAAIAKAKGKKAVKAEEPAQVVAEEAKPAAKPVQAAPVAAPAPVAVAVEEKQEKPLVPVYSAPEEEEEEYEEEYEEEEYEEGEYEEEYEEEEYAEEEYEEYEETENKAKDPFIATLTKAERVQFSEVFLLKTSGELSKLPAYEVGGENTEFFRKVFVYLGVYRDKIPSQILDKMYSFYQKNNE